MDSLDKERSKREQMQAEFYRNYQALQQSVRLVETDLQTRLKEQREVHIKMFDSVEEEKQRLMRLNGERTEISNNMMRDILSTIERKV